MAQAKQKAPLPTRIYTHVDCKAYNPKATHNQRSWEALSKALPCTMQEMLATLVYTVKGPKGEDVTVKHTNFIGYMIRGGHLKQEEKYNG